jgi:DNA polymerase III delta prime subunit
MYFFVEKLRPVIWDEQVISRLVIPQDRKELVQALVTEHIQGQSEFDDTIKGKGKGIIFLLHGPPGVGKTLTAECIAGKLARFMGIP